jgi:hypothetical protein
MGTTGKKENEDKEYSPMKSTFHLFFSFKYFKSVLQKIQYSKNFKVKREKEKGPSKGAFFFFEGYSPWEGL